ncbi:MAG TPA: PQQ-dependent sugar dehydrogenase [Xanthobacteraceae bacterium]|nr:PQQ-dependent sugar dehydrogenase [Xanthobacteraceae bacterium]
MRNFPSSCRVRFLAVPAAASALAALIGVGALQLDRSNSARAQGVVSTQALGGTAAFGSWHDDMPGRRRHLTVDALPAPYATRSVGNTVRVVRARADARLNAPPGFTVKQLASGLSNPRLLRIAPNGDIFVAETGAGRIRVLRTDRSSAAVEKNEIFASGLRGPFGIAFYPADNPTWVYVANMDSVVRFPYRAGDMEASGPAEIIVPKLPAGGHTTRDIAFSKDGMRMYISVGSATNDAEGMGRLDAAAVKRWEEDRPAGAAWGNDAERADVLVFNTEGQNGRIYAVGIRNCVGLAINPATGDPWCATNERDGMGDNLPPDYVTRVREGGFYGWPWYYMGAHEDPRHAGERPDLKDKVIIPDVLVQPHSAPLQMMFYTGDQFPADFKGNAFVALHGSWNRATRTGYKIIRVIVKDGAPTGEYEDFITGFVIDDTSVWGRPVGVAQTKDGALIFSEDGNGTIWRVSHAAE